MDFSLLSPVGQAAFGAVAAILQADVGGRARTALIAAAARGAASAPASQARPVEDQQAFLAALGKSSVHDALASMRAAGRADLARRFQRASRLRNGMAHPDVTLGKDLAVFAADGGPAPARPDATPPTSGSEASVHSPAQCVPLPSVPPFPTFDGGHETDAASETSEDGVVLPIAVGFKWERRFAVARTSVAKSEPPADDVGQPMQSAEHHEQKNNKNNNCDPAPAFLPDTARAEEPAETRDTKDDARSEFIRLFSEELYKAIKRRALAPWEPAG